jgi:hypothetical protein
MIEQYFPSKRKVVEPYKYVNRYQNNHLPVVHNTGAPSAFEEARAIKMGLTVKVYRHRVTEVSREQAKCTFRVGDTVFPTDPKDLEEYGGCIVTGVCRHYHDYGTVDWNEPPLILSVQPISDRGTILNASVGWAQKKAGIFETENFGDC